VCNPRLEKRRNGFEKILKHLTVDGKDVRKGDWNNKEVNMDPLSFIHFPFFHDDKEL